MYSLYIDSHMDNLVIALLLDGKLVLEKKMLSNKHSVNTISLIKEVLDSNNIKVDNISEIIIINGPGSFTGVRIGVVIAKVMGYTKNIKLKPISFLQAKALDYDRDITLGIKDRNGVFVGSFNAKHELIRDYLYLNNEEIINFDKEIEIIEDDIDISKVYMFLKDNKGVNPHTLKPLYVKKIEVQNG